MTDQNIQDLTVSDVEIVNIVMDSTKTPVVHIVVEESSVSDPDELTQYFISRIEPDKDTTGFVKLFFRKNIEEEGTDFAVSIPLQYAQVSQIVGMLLPTPNFVMSSESDIAEPSDSGDYEITDFPAIISFALSSSPEFAQTTSMLSRLTTGKHTVQLDIDVFNEGRAEMISLIGDVVNGESEALEKLFAYIEPLNAMVADKEKDDFQPSDEQQKLIILEDLTVKLLNATNPIMISSSFKGAAPTEDFIEDIESFEGIMRGSGIDDSFFADVSNDISATPESKIAHISKPLTKDNFPLKMERLVPSINLPEVYKTTWNSIEEPEQEEKLTGEITVAGMIMVAARLGRIEEVADGNFELEPTMMLIKALSVPGEQIIWAMNETIKLLSKNQFRPFNDVFTLTVPDAEEPRSALQAPLGFVLHEFGHLVQGEGWRKDILALGLKDYPIIFSFVDEILSSEGEHDHSEDDEESSMCVPARAAVNLLGLGFTIKDIVDQLGQAMMAMAELNAHKHTDYKKNSIDWDNYTKSYLASILEHNESDEDEDDDEDDFYG